MTPPDGSKIKIESDRGYEKILIPQNKGHFMRFGVAAFLLVWLGGWGFGCIAAFTQLLKGESGSGFLLFWLIAWSLGGIFAILQLFKLLRPSVPEELTITFPTLLYDSGTSPLSFSMSQNQSAFWKQMFSKRKKIEFSPIEIKTLRLRELDGNNRLTIDKGSERFVLATSLTEIEREWLYAHLAKQYKVEQGS